MEFVKVKSYGLKIFFIFYLCFLLSNAYADSCDTARELMIRAQVLSSEEQKNNYLSAIK